MAILDHAWVGWTLLGVGGVLCLWALFWDRARGRRRCKRCQYDMRAAVADDKGTFLCPECGTRHAHMKLLLRTRRRWRWVGVGVLLMLGAYAYDVAPGVRDRGWVAAVPTWVLVLGPMEVTLSDTVPTQLHVSSRWPAPLATEYEDWLDWSPPRRGMGGVSPFLTIPDRPKPSAMLRRLWAWRVERHLKAQDAWWVQGTPSAGLVVCARHPKHEFAKLLGFTGAASDTATLDAVDSNRVSFGLPDPWAWQGFEDVVSRSNCICEVVQDIVQRRQRDDARPNPYIMATYTEDEVWLWGIGESLELFHEIAASVRRVRVATQRRVWVSDVATEDRGELVVVRAMRDVMEELARKSSSTTALFRVHERYGIRTPAVKPEEERFVSLLVVVEDGAFAIAVQTPDQREAMDADLAAWRRELGLAP